MTTSEWIRAVIIVILAIVLILKQKGLFTSMKEKKKDQDKKAVKARTAELRKEKRARQIQKIQEKQQQNAQILKTSLGGDFAQKSVEVTGMTLHYFEGGQGTSTVLLLHGFASAKEDWTRFAKCLLHEGYRVVAVDLPGFGQNKKDPDVSYDVPTQAKRIRAFTEKLGLKGFHVVGSSIGGTIAGAYTYGFSQDVLTLTLIEPFCVRVPQTSELDELESQGRNPIGIATPEAYDNLLGFLFAQPPALPDSVKRLRAEDAVRNRDFYLKMWREVRSGDLRDPVFGHQANRALGLIIAGDSRRNYRGFGHTNSATAFGHGGAGGQIAWADPETGISLGYCTNGHDRNNLRQARRGIGISSRAAACGID